MSVTAAIRRMLAAGLSIEQALIAAEAFEAETAPQEPVLSKRQARNKRYYETHKASEKRLKASEQDVSDGGALLSDKERSPTPPKEINSPPSSLRSENKRATRLPTDWALPASWGRWALDQGLSEARVRLEADKFRDFWVSKGGKDAAKLDWEATWRNWIRNSGGGRSQAPPAQREPDLADRFNELAKKLQEQENHDDGRTIEGSYDAGDFHRPRQALPRPASS